MPRAQVPVVFGPVPSRRLGRSLGINDVPPKGSSSRECSPSPRSCSGELATETMLIRDVNDSDAAIDATAAFLERLAPSVAYLAAPTRPPAEPWVRPARESALNRAFQRLAERLSRAELLTEFEGTAFGTTGDPVEDRLAVAAVHPLRADAALALLARAGVDPRLLERLVLEDRLRPVRYLGHTFYVRRLPGSERDQGEGS